MKTNMPGAIAAFCASVLLVVLSSSTGAATVSFSGIQLIGETGVAFPTTTPIVSGTSLLFGSGAPSFGKLMTIDLSAIGLVATSASPVDLRVAINLTRRACDEALGDCVRGVFDWDPALLLSDGVRMSGTQINDPSPGAPLPDTFIFAEEQNDLGLSGQRAVHDFLASVDSYPDIGESVELRLEYSLAQATTHVAIQFGGREVGYDVADKQLHSPGQLWLVLMRDNDTGEQYQLNSLSISTREVIPEPSVVASLAFGIAGIVLFRRKLRLG